MSLNPLVVTMPPLSGLGFSCRGWALGFWASFHSRVRLSVPGILSASGPGALLAQGVPEGHGLCSGTMFGMIRNSLFGGTETSSGRVLKTEERDGITFEERVCDGGQYATVEVTGKPFDEASKEAVLQLLKYVGGSNEKGLGMGMTAPVSITAYPQEDGSLQPQVKVLLRIPSQYQAAPPRPTEESIRIEERESLTFYSTQFGGFAKEADYVAHAARLTSALGAEAVIHQDFYFCNGYDPPMKPYGRRNEVWLVKKD